MTFLSLTFLLWSACLAGYLTPSEVFLYGVGAALGMAAVTRKVEAAPRYC